MYGHLRTFELCYPAFKKNLLDLYDCDIFIHTWDKLEHSDRNYFPEEVYSDCITVEKLIKKKINQYYSPKSMKIETQNLFNREEEEKRPGNKIVTHRISMKYMTYSMYQSNLLREEYQLKHNVNYNFALVISFDIMLYAPLDFKKYAKEFKFHNRKSIHFGRILKSYLTSNRYLIIPSLIDRFYFSNPSVISDISKLYLEFDEFCKNVDLILPSKLKISETILYEYLHLNNINPSIRQFYYAIKRKESKYDLLSFTHNPVLVEMVESDFYKKKRIYNLLFKALDNFGHFIPRFLIDVYRKFFYMFKAIDTYMRIKKDI